MSKETDKVFPYATPAQAAAQNQRLEQAREYINTRGLSLAAIGSTFQYQPGPTVLVRK